MSVTEKQNMADKIRPLPGFMNLWIAERHRHVATFLWDAIVRHRWLVVFWGLANIGASAFEGTSMALLFLAINSLLGRETPGFMEAGTWFGDMFAQVQSIFSTQEVFLLLISFVAVTQILQSGFYFLGLVLSATLRIRIRRRVHKDLFNRMMTISFPEISKYKTGELWSYMLVGKHLDQMIGQLSTIVYTLLLSMAYAGVLLWISWQMTLAALGFIFVISFGLRTVMRRINEISKRLLDSVIDLNTRTADYLAGMRLVRSFGTEKEAMQNINVQVDRVMETAKRGLIWQATISPLMDIITVLTITFALLGMSFIFGDGFRDLLPVVLTFVLVLYRLLPRLGNINNTRAAMHSAWPHVSYSVDFLRKDNKSFTRRGGKPFRGIQQQVEFRDVSLSYTDKERHAVNGITFKIPANKSIAIVGESGAGKSSILDMILGLFEPTAGEILIDGISLNEIDLDDWRDNLSVVSQDTFLFNASIRDNIAFADREATEEMIISATKVAHAHEFIMELEGGYGTMVGERGFRLSGGQCQRVALARAVLRNPGLLILDEATSDLDSQSEQYIQEAFRMFGKGRTAIVVAHRLSTVRDMDEILVVKDGRLAERGTHEELIGRGGIYARMWELQV